MTLSGRDLDKQLIKLIKDNGRIHFNAILKKLHEISNETCNRKTLSRHLRRLCTYGIILKYASKPGTEVYYSLSADSEFALCVNKDFNLFPNKKFHRNTHEEQLKEALKLVLIRLAIMSYVKYLDPRLNHGPGTISLPMDKLGNVYTSFSFYLKDKEIELDVIPKELDHVPVEPISEGLGIPVRDLLQPPPRMSEMGNLYGHIPLSQKVLKECIDMLTKWPKLKPLVLRVNPNMIRNHIIINDRDYPALKNYVRDWLTLLLFLVYRMEYIWKNQGGASKDERKWYDKLFGDSHRSFFLESAKANRKRLSNLGSKEYEKVMKRIQLTIKKYENEIEERRIALMTNQEYKEIEVNLSFITKVLKEEIEESYKIAKQKSRR